MGARRRGGLAVIALTGAAALAPAAATAATATVTGDDGASVSITPGLTVRNMSPSVGYTLAANERYINATVTGPDGAQAETPRGCTSFVSNSGVDYRGNGIYTVTVQAFPQNDFDCSTPVGPPVISQFTVNATVSLTSPAGRILIRPPNSFTTRVIPVAIGLNPGALATEVRYARGGVVGADGAISGPSESAFVDSATGTVPLRLTKPGRYVVVARQEGFATSGDYFTPWSPPAFITAVAPFDLEGVTFPDARGPSYSVRGQVRERSARGSVVVSLGRGKKGPYRSLGRAKIRANGTFLKNFTERRFGTYRVRYRFTGSATTAGGIVVQRVSITRRVFFG